MKPKNIFLKILFGLQNNSRCSFNHFFDIILFSYDFGWFSDDADVADNAYDADNSDDSDVSSLGTQQLGNYSF